MFERRTFRCPASAVHQWLSSLGALFQCSCCNERAIRRREVSCAFAPVSRQLKHATLDATNPLLHPSKGPLFPLAIPPTQNASFCSGHFWGNRSVFHGKYLLFWWRVDIIPTEKRAGYFEGVAGRGSKFMGETTGFSLLPGQPILGFHGCPVFELDPYSIIPVAPVPPARRWELQRLGV